LPADRSATERLARSRGGSGTAPPLLEAPLGSFATRVPVSCAPTTPIREVLETLAREAVGAMVVVDDERRPVGVFTLRDVLERVALPGVEPTAPVASVMASNVFSLPSHALGFEAAVMMARQGLRYVLVVEDGRLTGVVSESRLFSVWRGGIGDTSAVIRAARDVDEMVAATAGIRELVDRLLDERVPSEAVTRIVTTLNDLVTERLIEIVGADHALRAAGGCWIALGSQGRTEQTLATDQDNGIIFADNGDAAAHRHTLLPLARRVNEALDRCGFPLCRGDVMASNPKWCLSLDEWHERFRSWIDEPDPQALLNAAIFFDFRAIHGDHTMVAELRAWLAQYAEDRGRFLLPMAQNALAHRPPLGLVRDFVLTRTGPHPGTLDLKVNGVQLFVEIARIYSLASRGSATNTLERLATWSSARNVPQREIDALSEAFRFIQYQRLALNSRQRARREALHNDLDSETLNDFDRRMLKEALRQARDLQSRLARDFAVAPASFGA